MPKKIFLKNPLVKIRWWKASMQHDSLVRYSIGKALSQYGSKFLLYAAHNWEVHENLMP